MVQVRTYEKQVERNTLNPVDRPTPGSDAQFGGGIARALQAVVGAQAQKQIDRSNRRISDRAYLDVIEATGDYWHKPLEGYDTPLAEMDGEMFPEASSKAMDALSKRWDEIKTGLNQTQLDMVEPHVNRTILNFGDKLSGREASVRLKLDQGQFANSQDAALFRALKDSPARIRFAPNGELDVAEADAVEAELSGRIRDYAFGHSETNGDPAVWIEAKLGPTVSKAYESMVQGLLDEGRVDEAEALVALRGDRMLPGTRASVEDRAGKTRTSLGADTFSASMKDVFPVVVRGDKESRDAAFADMEGKESMTPAQALSARLGAVDDLVAGGEINASEAKAYKDNVRREWDAEITETRLREAEVADEMHQFILAADAPMALDALDELKRSREWAYLGSESRAAVSEIALNAYSRPIDQRYATNKIRYASLAEKDPQKLVNTPVIQLVAHLGEPGTPDFDYIMRLRNGIEAGERNSWIMTKNALLTKFAEGQDWGVDELLEFTSALESSTDESTPPQEYIKTMSRLAGDVDVGPGFFGRSSEPRFKVTIDSVKPEHVRARIADKLMNDGIITPDMNRSEQEAAIVEQWVRENEAKARYESEASDRDRPDTKPAKKRPFGYLPGLGL